MELLNKAIVVGSLPIDFAAFLALRKVVVVLAGEGGKIINDCFFFDDLDGAVAGDAA